MLALQNFQQRLYAHYKKGLSLPPTYAYLYGNPVQPLAPVETACRSVCIIGAYPSARLATLRGKYEAPVADHNAPFPSGLYFDGKQVQSISDADELAVGYLAPLGLHREQCWLTYLVKIFLFRDEHLARYRRLGCAWPEWETHSRFEVLARQSLDWLEEELALARPRLVITLGVEVAGVLQNVPGLGTGQALLGGHVQDVWLGETVYPAIHLAAPHAVLRPNNETYRLHWQTHLLAARQVVKQLVR